VDIVPTILDLVDVDIPDCVEGSTLIPDIATGCVQGRSCYFETLFGKLESGTGITRLGFQEENWKLVLNRLENPAAGKAKEHVELYNLAADPEERNNLSATYPEERDRIRSLLKKFLREHPPGRANLLTPDDATRRKLKALGYK